MFIQFQKYSLLACIILYVSFLSCNSKISGSNRVDNGKSEEVDNIYDISYNVDSTFFVMYEKEPLSVEYSNNFYIINSIKKDTVFIGNNSKYFLSWLNDSTVLFREKYGIKKEIRDRDLSSTKENFTDFKINIYTKKVTAATTSNK